MDLNIVEKRIVDLLEEGKSTVEIASILTKEGHSTVKGDVYLRKAVNNKITMMRAKGLEVPLLRGENKEGREKPTKKKQPKLTLIEPYIYRTVTGKFRFRKYMGKNLCMESFGSLHEAQQYKAKILDSDFESESDSNPNPIPTLHVPAKAQPQLSKIVFTSPVEEKSSKSTVIITDNIDLITKLAQEAWRN